jgi:hypothetical protein
LFQETKDEFGEYPKINKTVIPNEFNDITLNSIAAIFQPLLFNNFNSGLAEVGQWGKHLEGPGSGRAVLTADHRDVLVADAGAQCGAQERPGTRNSTCHVSYPLVAVVGW